MIPPFRRCTRATAAIEAAIFTPIFLMFMCGITDLGGGMLARLQDNAATQSGAIYAVINSGTGQSCASVTTACLNGIKAVINDATGDASFCTNYTCTASIAACPSPDGPSTACITVSASYPYSPLLPDTIYSWATSSTITSTTTVRVL